MATATSSKSVDLDAIQALVHQGKTVVSSEDSAIIKWASKKIAAGDSLTLYLKPTVFEAIRRWYWTPDRMSLAGLKPVTTETNERVKSDFGIDIDGYANSLECPRCGDHYSTYEFISQGVEEHGEEMVRKSFSLKRAAILQVNPVQNIACRKCGLHILNARSRRNIIIYYTYDYWCVAGNAYACCSSHILNAPPVIAATA